MIVQTLARLYHYTLLLYPRDFRAEFGDEMVKVFTQAAIAAARTGGFALAQLCLGELASLPRCLYLARRSQRRIRALPAGNANPLEHPWQELLLNLALFLLPAGLILNLRPPGVQLRASLLAVCLFLGVMALTGWLGGASLWSRRYLGVVLVIAAYLVVFQWVAELVSPVLISGLTPGALDRSSYLLLKAAAVGMYWLTLFCLTLLVVALLAVLNRFQPLLGHARGDWTSFSFILYGESIFVLLLLFESRRFERNYAFAVAFCALAGVWFYLRSPARLQRLLALVGCLTLAVGIVALDSRTVGTGSAPASIVGLLTTDPGRLLLSWGWMVVALLLPAVLARWSNRRGQTPLQTLLN